MNLPVCPNHGDRKQELICLTDNCTQRFEPKCVQCMMTSKCKVSHSWKMISQAIQQIFQACENRQIRQERKGSKEKKVNPINQLHQKHIQSTIKQMKSRINQMKDNMIQNIQRKASRLLAKVAPSIGNHFKVKQLLRFAKKEADEDKFRNKFKDVGVYMTCLANGTIDIVEGGNQQHQLQDIDISIFQNESNKMLDNVSMAIFEDGSVPEHTKIMQKNYEDQIDKLLVQLKEFPVLQNRIQSLNQKLQAKEAKIRKLQGQQTSSQLRQDLGPKKSSSTDEVQRLKNKTVSRIQSLIKRRQQLFNAFQQYTQKNRKQQLYIYKLHAGVNALKLEIPVNSKVAYLLNQNSLSICDELQFLGYSDSTGEEQTIQIPLISEKQKQPKPKVLDPDINPLLLLLMGLR